MAKGRYVHLQSEEATEDSKPDAELLEIFRNSKGPVSVIRDRKTGRLIVTPTPSEKEG